MMINVMQACSSVPSAKRQPRSATNVEPTATHCQRGANSYTLPTWSQQLHIANEEPITVNEPRTEVGDQRGAN